MEMTGVPPTVVWSRIREIDLLVIFNDLKLWVAALSEIQSFQVGENLNKIY